MSKKKIVLLSIIAVLSAILILQLTLGGSDAYENISLDDTVSIDELRIEKPDGESLELFLENGSWTVSDQHYPGDQGKIETLVDKISDVKIIDAVSSRKLYERYEVDEERRITVTAYQKGDLLRTLHIGKASATSRQSYLLLDEGEDVYLVSGNYRRDFDKKAGDFRDKTIFSIDQESITRLSLSGRIEDSEGDFTKDIGVISLEKDSDSGEWAIAGPLVPEGAAVDSEKMNNYLRGFAALRASDFDVPPGASSAEEELYTVEVDSLKGKYFLSIVEKLEGGFYLCRSSASQYFFRLSAYNAEKFMKASEDFTADE